MSIKYEIHGIKNAKGEGKEQKYVHQGRRITFLYDNQRYFLEKYYLYSPKKHEYLDYIEQYPRSAS